MPSSVKLYFADVSFNCIISTTGTVKRSCPTTMVSLVKVLAPICLDQSNFYLNFYVAVNGKHTLFTGTYTDP